MPAASISPEAYRTIIGLSDDDTAVSTPDTSLTPATPVPATPENVLDDIGTILDLLIDRHGRDKVLRHVSGESWIDIGYDGSEQDVFVFPVLSTYADQRTEALSALATNIASVANRAVLTALNTPIKDLPRPTDTDTESET